MDHQLEMGRANLEVFAETLMEMAKDDPDLIVVTSDSRGSGKLVKFGETFPDQIVEVGIAEQNLVGIAAGLAAAGKKVFAVSPACFLSARSFEQIKNDVAYSDQPVNVIGISAGVSYGALGTTHHSIHDFAALRAVNNISILAPADNFETAEAIKSAYKSNKPNYIRFGKKPLPHLNTENTHFKIGQSIQVKDGDDLAFIATGETVNAAYRAALLLEKENIKARVVSYHTVRPLDEEALMDAAGSCKAVVTVEEHMVNGGLGEACASVLMENNMPVLFKKVGIPDEYTVTGSQQDIFNHYGITDTGLAETAKTVLSKYKVVS